MLLFTGAPKRWRILLSYPYVKVRAFGRVTGRRSCGQKTAFRAAMLLEKPELRRRRTLEGRSPLVLLCVSPLSSDTLPTYVQVRRGWPVNPCTKTTLFGCQHPNPHRKVSPYSSAAEGGSAKTVRPCKRTSASVSGVLISKSLPPISSIALSKELQHVSMIFLSEAGSIRLCVNRHHRCYLWGLACGRISELC